MNATSPAIGKPHSPASRPGVARLKDVAELVGVSTMTASVVLNGAGKKTTIAVSDQTREKVLLAAAELGYKRNGSMVAARTGRFDCVALLLSTNDTYSDLPKRMWDGIHDELAAHNLTLSMARLPDEKLTDKGTVPKILREWMADGLLIDYTNAIPEKMVELINAHRLPAIWINSQQPGDCVFPDDFDAGRRATRHLIDLGHQRIVYANFAHIAGDELEHYSGRDRQGGYEKAMSEANLQARVLVRECEDDEFEADVARLMLLLSGADAPTAMVAYGRLEPERAFVAADRLGLRVPDDFSIVSLAMPTPLWGRTVTTFCVPEFEIGRGAVEMLRQKIENPGEVLPPQTFAFDFEPGQTCAPPAK